MSEESASEFVQRIIGDAIKAERDNLAKFAHPFSEDTFRHPIKGPLESAGASLFSDVFDKIRSTVTGKPTQAEVRRKIEEWKSEHGIS
jgi:hypothetical protein